MTSGGVAKGPSKVDPERFAQARARTAELLALLDDLDLCQAAAYVSMAVDTLDRLALEGVPTDQF